MRFRPRKNSVRVTKVRKDKRATNGFVYELTPTSYEGPWELKLGTELVVFTEPKK